VTASPGRRVAAWAVHLLTAASAPAGLLALFATVRGDVQTAFAWMAVTVVIDSIDGTLARAVGVKVVVPHIDGALLDNVVDYLTWSVLPAAFIVLQHMVPEALALPVVAAITMSSALGFANTRAKTSDHFFTGFPSYWNLVVFYLWLLQCGPATNAAVLLLLAVLVFVPIRYVYPSRTPTLRWLTNSLGVLWAIALAYLLYEPAAPRWMAMASLAYPAYYFGLSLVLHVRTAR
jgi:phosphatidylcholine synthase